MRGDAIANLGWLPKTPSNFRKRVKELDPANLACSELRAIANHSLNTLQLNILARIYGEISNIKTDLSPLRPIKLGLLSNSTTSLLKDAITASGLRHGLAIEIFETDYGQVAQTALSSNSILSNNRVDMVLLALDADGLPLVTDTCATIDKSVEIALDYIDSIRTAIHKNIGALTIVQTVPVPPQTLFGHMDITVGNTIRATALEFNRGLVERLADSADLIFDVAAISEIVGTANWFDPVMRHLAKLAFSQEYVPLYADHVCRILAAQCGLSKRVLVLDLDNTIWGGTIGDDGLEGIEIGVHSPVGEAYTEVQKMALQLRERGIILAVSSKNNDEIAHQPFHNHPDMLLKEEHISVFQANWLDKATNLRRISDILNLGTDSIVLLDDNPVERAQVRRELPEVGVPELPEDPAFYPRVIAASGYFETVTFSQEDSRRSQLYHDNSRRKKLRQNSSDLDAFLSSLNMVIQFAPFDAVSNARIVQLINKTNQFNLTTRRYTQTDIDQFEDNPEFVCIQTRLTDQFGDNGMISVVICRGKGSTSWEIDTWLMSCRVIGRKVEEATLNQIVRLAKMNGANELIGVHRPTPRNSLVKSHYQNLGFRLLEPYPSLSEETRWALDLNSWEPRDCLTMQVQTKF